MPTDIALYGSLAVIVLLMLTQATFYRWPPFRSEGHSRWLDVSAGTALAYVFAHLLPKLASSQEKFTGVPVSEAAGYLRHHVYLIALAGLVFVYWLETATERAAAGTATRAGTANWAPWLLIGGYGFYFMQLGYLLADMPRPEPLSYLLIGLVLGLHVMGIVHGLRSMNPHRYQRVLRWVYPTTTLTGWLIGVLTVLPATVVLLFSAFIAGGIIVIAIREELPGDHHASFPVFLMSVTLTSMAILLVHELQAGP